MDLYRIVWEFKDGRHGGNGNPISQQAAEANAEAMNRKYPDIYHWIEPVVEEPEMPRPPR